MKSKRFIAISAAALVMAGSTAAYGAMIDAGSLPVEEETKVQLVQVPAPVIDAPIQRAVVIAGPVQAQTLQAGPVFSSDAPLVGSIDWMAQQKAEKDRIKLEAQLRQKAVESKAARDKAELEAEIARLKEVAENTEKLNAAIALVKKQVGKTYWVFSGSTPSGWDCSGLVRWTYAHLGVDLIHRASVQRLSGEIVTEPKIGDLVSFNYENSNSAYHIGIYIGPDEMIHAGGKRGDRTEIVSISGWAKGNGNSEFTYTRIVETNN